MLLHSKVFFSNVCNLCWSFSHFSAAMDYETVAFYQVTVDASDGTSSAVVKVTINVNPGKSVKVFVIAKDYLS